MQSVSHRARCITASTQTEKVISASKRSNAQQSKRLTPATFLTKGYNSMKNKPRVSSPCYESYADVDIANLRLPTTCSMDRSCLNKP